MHVKTNLTTLARDIFTDNWHELLQLSILHEQASSVSLKDKME